MPPIDLFNGILLKAICIRLYAFSAPFDPEHYLRYVDLSFIRRSVDLRIKLHIVTTIGAEDS